MISLSTQRFGLIERPDDAVLRFSGGIFGFELNHSWLLLGDSEHGSLYWLQSTEQADLSLSVVDPRDFVRDFSLDVGSSDSGHNWLGAESLIVLVVLSQDGEQLVLNLRNPIVINPKLRTGRQIVTSGDAPIRYELPVQPASLKQSA